MQPVHNLPSVVLVLILSTARFARDGTMVSSRAAKSELSVCSIFSYMALKRTEGRIVKFTWATAEILLVSLISS